LVLDLRIVHDRFGSSSDPNLNGKLHWPNDTVKSLNEAAADKIRKYRADYNNNPPNSISFMPAIASTSGRLHSEFIRILLLQAHRETDPFFAASRGIGCFSGVLRVTLRVTMMFSTLNRQTSSRYFQLYQVTSLLWKIL
jgi:hypothetical protein